MATNDSAFTCVFRNTTAMQIPRAQGTVTSFHYKKIDGNRSQVTQLFLEAQLSGIPQRPTCNYYSSGPKSKGKKECNESSQLHKVNVYKLLMEIRARRSLSNYFSPNAANSSNWQKLSVEHHCAKNIGFELFTFGGTNILEVLNCSFTLDIWTRFDDYKVRFLQFLHLE